MSSKKEIAFNASRWMEAFKKEREDGRCPKGIGAIFIMFDNANPTESAVCVGSINPDGVVAACKGILKKLGKDPDSRIIKPGDLFQ